jgi:hypothetical protein
MILALNAAVEAGSAPASAAVAGGSQCSGIAARETTILIEHSIANCQAGENSQPLFTEAGSSAPVTEPELFAVEAQSLYNLVNGLRDVLGANRERGAASSSGGLAPQPPNSAGLQHLNASLAGSSPTPALPVPVFGLRTNQRPA